MKITKTVYQKVTEEVPFSWTELINDLNNFDWFNPEDPEEWDSMVEQLEDKYSYEELDQHRDEIIQFMKDSRNVGVKEELNYYIKDALDQLFYNNIYNITEEEIHNYIKAYFNK